MFARVCNHKASSIGYIPPAVAVAVASLVIMTEKDMQAGREV